MNDTTVQVTIRNRLNPTAPMVPSISACSVKSSDCFVEGEQCIPDGGQIAGKIPTMIDGSLFSIWTRSFDVPLIDKYSFVRYATELPGALNTLYFHVSVNRRLPSGTIIALRGLHGFTHDGATVPTGAPQYVDLQNNAQGYSGWRLSKPKLAVCSDTCLKGSGLNGASDPNDGTGGSLMMFLQTPTSPAEYTVLEFTVQLYNPPAGFPTQTIMATLDVCSVPVVGKEILTTLCEGMTMRMPLPLGRDACSLDAAGHVTSSTVSSSGATLTLPCGDTLTIASSAVTESSPPLSGLNINFGQAANIGAKSASVLFPDELTTGRVRIGPILEVTVPQAVTMAKTGVTLRASIWGTYASMKIPGGVDLNMYESEQWRPVNGSVWVKDGTPYVEATISKVGMYAAFGWFGYTQDAKIIKNVLNETTKLVNVTNLLMWTFAFTPEMERMARGATITLKGLFGAQTDSTSSLWVSVSSSYDAQDASAFGMYGNWSQERGTLVLTVPPEAKLDMPPPTNYSDIERCPVYINTATNESYTNCQPQGLTVKFFLRNGPNPQQPSTPTMVAQRMGLLVGPIEATDGKGNPSEVLTASTYQLSSPTNAATLAPKLVSTCLGFLCNMMYIYTHTGTLHTYETYIHTSIHAYPTARAFLCTTHSCETYISHCRNSLCV